jgi:glyoxylase-like metal-dependent hydrolase (beta-lactamase superfamily II)
LIVPLHASNPGVFTGAGNWTYLITGSTPVLIDAGVGEPAHLDAIAAHVPDGPAHVLVTHGHPDHAMAHHPFLEVSLAVGRFEVPRQVGAAFG